MLDLQSTLVLIKGAGDLASGVAARLHRCGFPVVMTELPKPVMVQRTVGFGEAVYKGHITIEGITAHRVVDVLAARAALAQGLIPVLIDPAAACRAELALGPHGEDPSLGLGRGPARRAVRAAGAIT